jgi:ParB family chromosome partitioning protein
VPSKRKGGFFAVETRPEDEEARRSDLEALIVRQHSVPREIGVERIEPNPFQARRAFEGIDELAAAIRAQGFTSRLRVRPHPDRPNYFQLAYGERRLQAARAAGLTEVPCEVADHTDAELVEIGLAENIQRRDLAPLEEAQAFQTFIMQRDYSIRTLAERIGKDKSYVEDRLKLLQAPEDVQQMVEQRPDSLRAAREIAKLATPQQRQPLIAGVLAGEITTADVRERVRDVAPAQIGRSRSALTADARAIVERDVRNLRAMLTRWADLAAQSEEAHTLVSEQTEALLREVQRLVETLEQ